MAGLKSGSNMLMSLRRALYLRKCQLRRLNCVVYHRGSVSSSRSRSRISTFPCLRYKFGLYFWTSASDLSRLILQLRLQQSQLAQLSTLGEQMPIQPQLLRTLEVGVALARVLPKKVLREIMLRRLMHNRITLSEPISTQ